MHGSSLAGHLYSTTYPNDAMTLRVAEFGTTNWDTLSIYKVAQL